MLIEVVKIIQISASIDFLETQFKYQNPEVVLGINGGSIQWASVSNPGRNLINDDITYEISGDGRNSNLIFNINDNYYLTRLGWNALAAEFYNDEKTNSNDLANILEDIDIKYLAHVNGYTDKKIIDVSFDGFNNKGRILLSDEDYSIVLDSSPSKKSIYYSGIKIEKENNRFKVSGFNFDQKWFNYFPPLESGNSINVDINDNVRVNRYNNYSNISRRVYYNSTYIRRQDLYNFIIGLGE